MEFNIGDKVIVQTVTGYVLTTITSIMPHPGGGYSIRFKDIRFKDVGLTTSIGSTIIAANDLTELEKIIYEV